MGQQNIKDLRFRDFRPIVCQCGAARFLGRGCNGGACIVTNREDLGANLVSAEAALARAVIKSVNASADWARTKLELDGVRTYCRQLRAALVELDGAGLIANIDKARSYCRELRVFLLELNPSATIPFHCDAPSCGLFRSPRTTCWLDSLDGVIGAFRPIENSLNSLARAPAPTSGLPAINRPDIGISAEHPTSTNALARSQLLRQTVGFLALILAYVAYFHVDVQLQIVGLPWIFP